MSIWFRLAAMCFALAFVGGSIAHGVTGTAMALEMASAMSMDASSDAKCPACADETDGQIMVCSFDCTTPGFAYVPEPAFLALMSGSMLPAPSLGSPLRGYSVGFDPAPPRTSILI